MTGRGRGPGYIGSHHLAPTKHKNGLQFTTRKTYLHLIIILLYTYFVFVLYFFQVSFFPPCLPVIPGVEKVELGEQLPCLVEGVGGGVGPAPEQHQVGPRHHQTRQRLRAGARAARARSTSINIIIRRTTTATPDPVMQKSRSWSLEFQLDATFAEHFGSQTIHEHLQTTLLFDQHLLQKLNLAENLCSSISGFLHA